MTTSTSSTGSTAASTYALSTSASGAASISGLASGIDTTSLITSLMQVEAEPQTALKAKLSTNQAQTTLLQGINTKLAALTTSASALSTGTALGAATATVTTPGASTSSTPVVTASVTGTPVLGALAVTVTSVATAQSAEFYGTGTSGAWTVGSSVTGTPALSLTANGTTTALTPASYSAADVAAAINASSSGVKATVVTDNSTSTPVQHLILTAPTGAFSDLNLKFTATGTNAGHSTVTAGTDAAMTVNGIAMTSHTNTFTGVIDGLDLTATAVSPVDSSSHPITSTVSVTQNTSSVVTSVKGVIDQLASVMADLTLATTPPAQGTTASATAGGLFAGNSTLRSTMSSLVSTVIGALGSGFTAGQTPADAGIETQSDGTITLDTDKLTSFLTANPSVAQSVLTNFGTALSSAASAASTPGIGTITQAVTDLQSNASTLNTEIDDWTDRLALRQATLQAQYTAMETALSQLQSQSNALTSALKQLDTSSS